VLCCAPTLFGAEWSIIMTDTGTTTMVRTHPAAPSGDLEMAQLKPRAVAVLVLLRGGPRTARQLRAMICDESLGATDDLISDMRRRGLIELAGSGAPVLSRIGQPSGWQLTQEGRALLERSGIKSATPPAE